MNLEIKITAKDKDNSVSSKTKIEDVYFLHAHEAIKKLLAEVESVAHRHVNKFAETKD